MTPSGADVSRETQQRLDIIVFQVRKWQPHINLISTASLVDIWSRHVADSLQLRALAPTARKWLDIGSGGGFPGLVVAAELAEVDRSSVTLVESNHKKCAFLRETARIAGFSVEVLPARIESVLPVLLKQQWDVVSARALAPLHTLLEMTAPLIQNGAIGLFPKGRDAEDEIRYAECTWNFSYDLIHSITDPTARIVRVRSAQKREMQ